MSKNKAKEYAPLFLLIVMLVWLVVHHRC